MTVRRWGAGLAGAVQAAAGGVALLVAIVLAAYRSETHTDDGGTCFAGEPGWAVAGVLLAFAALVCGGRAASLGGSTGRLGRLHFASAMLLVLWAVVEFVFLVPRTGAGSC